MSEQSAPQRVLLDTATLYSAVLRDTLLRAAEAALFVPLWSEEILTELVRALSRDAKVSVDSADQLIRALRLSFPGSIVQDYPDISAALAIHPEDRHVLAAAIAGEASKIVTPNLRHFPREALQGTGVVAISPDVFLLSLIEFDSNAMNQILIEQAADLRRPPLSVEDVLYGLRSHAPEFVQRIRTTRASNQSED